jgi:hypothetical protein
VEAALFPGEEVGGFALADEDEVGVEKGLEEGMAQEFGSGLRGYRFQAEGAKWGAGAQRK